MWVVTMAYYYNQDFLEKYAGKGLSLTDMFHEDLIDGLGKTRVVTGEDKISDSIYSILSTRVGERMFLPEYGSLLYTINFEQNTYISCDLAIVYTEEALAKWEKRIIVDRTEAVANFDNNVIEIKIFYHYRNSNVTGSYVYPFNIKNSGSVDVYELN